MGWLNDLLDNRQFALIGAPLIAMAVGGWLVADFIKTRRAVKRGEPLKVWYLRHPVYPSDAMYSYFAFQREYPAILLFVFAGLIVFGLGGLIAWIIFWPPHPQP